MRVIARIGIVRVMTELSGEFRVPASANHLAWGEQIAAERSRIRAWLAAETIRATTY